LSVKSQPPAAFSAWRRPRRTPRIAGSRYAVEGLERATVRTYGIQLGKLTL
jgi:hypothetical protein